MVNGCPMYRIVCKLKALKGDFKKLHLEGFDHIFDRVDESYNELDAI